MARRAEHRQLHAPNFAMRLIAKKQWRKLARRSLAQ
jgi:hypothetical protein